MLKLIKLKINRPKIQHSKLSALLIFLCLLSSVTQLTAEDLNQKNELIKNDSTGDSSYSGVRNVLNGDHLKEEDPNSFKKDLDSNSKVPNEKTPIDQDDTKRRATIPSDDYELQNGWMESESDDILQLCFNEKLEISFDEKFDFEFNRMKLEFDYYIVKPDQPFKGLIEILNRYASESTFKLEPNKWNSQTFSIQKLLKPTDALKFKINFFKSTLNQRLKVAYSDDEISNDEMLGRDASFSSNAKKYSIYIKNIKVILKPEAGHETIYDLNKNAFEALIDNNRIPKQILPDYRFLPKLTDEILGYFYTFDDSRSISWSLKNEDLKYQDDICLHFEYQASKQSVLKVKVQRQGTNFFQLLDLDSTVFRYEKQIETNEKPNAETYIIEKTKWTRVNLCLRDLFPNCYKVKDFYKLKFESVIGKDTNTLGFVAMTELRVEEKPYRQKSKAKNYLTNWRTNGSSAFAEWVKFTEDTDLVVKTDDTARVPTKNLEFILKIKAYTSTKIVCILSEWIEIEENEGE